MPYFTRNVVRKVSNSKSHRHGHWYWHHLIGHIQYPISLLVSAIMSLSRTISDILSVLSQNLNRLVGWSLTALSTKFKSYRAFKVELYYKY